MAAPEELISKFRFSRYHPLTTTSRPSRLDRFFMYVTGGGPMSSSRASWVADGGTALFGVWLVCHSDRAHAFEQVPRQRRNGHDIR